MAPREDDKAMAGLLARSLVAKRGAQGAGAENDCPGPDTLAAYYERSLDRDETSQYELHFSQCVRCREQLATMARAEQGPQAKLARLWLWDWRWLGSAAAVLLFVAIWAARQLTPVQRTDQVSKGPLVAMSRTEQNPVPQVERAPLSSLTAPSPPAAPPRAQPPSESAPSSGLRPPAGKQQRSRDLPLNGRSFTQLDALVAGPNAPARVPPSTAADAQDTTAAPQGVTSPAPTARTARPSTGAVEGFAGGTEGRNGTDSSAKASKTEPMQAAAASGVTRMDQPVQAEAAVERSAQILIRTPNPEVLWRVAGGGLVERSENGGATWHGQLPAVNARLVAGAAPGGKVCWLVGRDGLILLTKDATNWEKIPPPIPADFVAVRAKDGSSATVTAADGQKFMTGDGGKKWTPGRR
jgi:hypothetical protein